MKNLDFLPERIKQQRSLRKRLLRQGYLLGLCAVALVLLGFLREGRISKAQAQMSMLADRAENVQQQIRQRNCLERQQAELMIMQRIDDTLGSRAGALDILGEISSLMPESMALMSLNMETMEVKLPAKASEGTNISARASVALPSSGERKEASVKRVRLVITGIAPSDVDVANFIGQLSASPLFEDVNMGYTRNTVFRNRSVREFQASCFIVR